MTKSRLMVIATLTVVGLLASFVLLLRETGIKPLNQPHTPPWQSHEYRTKWNMIAPLMDSNRRKPFTPQEIQLLRKLVKDELWIVRGDALIAFSFTPDSEQRKEAIELAVKGLNDPHRYVRQMALIALWRLNAKDKAERILPLLEDPVEEVRKTAKQVLKRWGYKVR